MSNASSPTPVDDHDPSAAWDDFDVYKYKDQHGTVQGPFALEHMRRWAAAGQLPPRTHVLPSSREGKGLESDGFVHLNSLRAIWQPPREGRDADAPSRRHDYER
eukprot:COSAG04_NODE_16745_length_490_cov_1.012788_1_plen_103_part_10